jgi:hypothetical protein
MLGGSADHQVNLKQMSVCGFMVNADKYGIIWCLQRQGVRHTRSGAHLGHDRTMRRKSWPTSEQMCIGARGP